MKKIKLLLVFFSISFATCSIISQQDNNSILSLQELSPISAEQAGIASDSIDKLLDLLAGIEIPDFRSLVVIKNGGILVESYYNTYGPETIHDIRSAGKSVTALCMGIAVGKGFVKSENESVYSFFPKVDIPAALRQKNADITIKPSDDDVIWTQCRYR